jgi:hypothetical protein
MRKEFFTLQEAVGWLSKLGRDEFTREDILRANEKGHISIYLDHTGDIGVFPDYSGPNSYLFPKPAQRIYFKGVLRSVSPCNRGVKTYLKNGQETTSDILRPHKVEVVQSEILHCHPEIITINAVGTFWGRVRASDVYAADKHLPNGQIVHGRRVVGQIAYYLDTSEIPESAWRFHIDDLCNLAGLTKERSPPQSEAPVSNAGALSAAEPSIDRFTTLIRHDKLTAWDATRGAISLNADRADTAPAAKVKAAPRLREQEKQILAWLKENGHDAQNLPRVRNGCPTVKANARAALHGKGVFTAKTAFGKAWGRLRDGKEIKENPAPHK